MRVALHNTGGSRFLAAFLTLFFVLAAAVPGAARADQLHGAQLHSLWPSSTIEDSEREIDLLADSGANVARIDISWSSIETEAKGGYSPWYLEKADRIFQYANDRGLKIVAVFWGTPCWASAAPASLTQGCQGAWWDRDVDRYAPRNMNDFGDAAAFVAHRWGSKLAAIEIWNEPNLSDQYQLHADNPAATAAAMQKTAYPRIKAEAPNLPVLAGVLSGSDGTFLEKMYSYGIGGNFDGVSIHPYNESRDPDDPWDEQWKQWSFLRGVPWIHQIMASHGDGDKGLWLTEFGFSTCRDGDRWCVNAQQQAEYVADSFRIARRWSYVKAALVYNLRNKGSGPSREDQYGLLNRDFSPKPAWNSFRDAMAAANRDDGQAATTTEAAPPAAAPSTAPVPQLATSLPVTVTPNGVLPVPLACPATASTTCAGTVTIETKPIRQGKRKKRLRLGRRHVRVGRGTVKVIKIKIPARHRPLLRRLGKLRVPVVVSASGSQVSASRASTNRADLTLFTKAIAVPGSLRTRK